MVLTITDDVNKKEGIFIVHMFSLKVYSKNEVKNKKVQSKYNRS